MEKDIDIKKVIELSTWETENLNRGLKYLIESQLKSPEKVKDIPEDDLKSVAWLITWRSINFL